MSFFVELEAAKTSNQKWMAGLAGGRAGKISGH